MKRWLLRPKAEDDLREIRSYTQREWGDAQVRVYLAAIRAAIRRAAKAPDLGSLYQHPRQEYRTVRSGRHLIIYRLSGDTVLIVRILHDRMDVETQLG